MDAVRAGAMVEYLAGAKDMSLALHLVAVMALQLAETTVVWKGDCRADSRAALMVVCWAGKMDEKWVALSVGSLVVVKESCWAVLTANSVAVLRLR